MLRGLYCKAEGCTNSGPACHKPVIFVYDLIEHTVPTRVGGSRYKLPGPGCLEGGPGPDYVAYVFVFLSSIIICRLYKLTLSDQAQVILQLRVSLSDLV